MLKEEIISELEINRQCCSMHALFSFHCVRHYWI